MGGILLGLLFFTDWYFPKSVAEAATADVGRTVIRIRSSHRWPAAVRIDTSVPLPHVTPSTVVASDTPVPASATPVREAYAYVPPVPAKAADKPQRRARPISRLSSRQTHRRLAYQSNWFPTAW